MARRLVLLLGEGFPTQMDDLSRTDLYAVLLPNGRLYQQVTANGDTLATYDSKEAAATQATELAAGPRNRLGVETQPLPQVVHQSADGAWRPVYEHA